MNAEMARHGGLAVAAVETGKRHRNVAVGAAAGRGGAIGGIFLQCGRRRPGLRAWNFRVIYARAQPRRHRAREIIGAEKDLAFEVIPNVRAALNPPLRRLSDKIVDAFDQACSSQDLEVAEGLYRVFELVLTRHGGKGSTDNRENVAFIMEAADKLRAIRDAKGAG